MKKIKKLILLAFLILIPIIKVNAASGVIDIYSSSKSPLVGNTITVTVYCSSSSTIGTCEYTLSYDSSKLKFVQANDSASCKNTYCIYYAGNKRSSKTFQFKVIASGSSTISIKSKSILDMNETEMSTSVSGVTINAITQAQLEASYSTNNYLSNLTVSGATLSPSFNKDTSDYSVTLEPNVEKITVTATRADSTATVSGAGAIEVSEGENKITITVTSQKGTKRTYNIVATVIDNNPINVKINDIDYTVIKKASILEKPNTYQDVTIDINGIKVPGFYGEISNYHLVGLKDVEGNTILAIYDQEKNTYKIYNEISFNNLTINVLDEEFKIPDNYFKEKITISEKEVIAYKYNTNSNYSLIYGLNIETGEKNIYLYEQTENTIQIYNDEEIKELENKLQFANYLIYGLGAATFLLCILIIVLIINKTKKINQNLKIKTAKKEEKKDIQVPIKEEKKK